VRFRTADAQDRDALQPAGPFDAIVGRLVLMYSDEPAATLHRLVELARPGGIVAFEEIDLAVIGGSMHPPGPLFERVKGWIREGFAAMGAHPAMGFELYSTFLTAGLPAPVLQFNTVIGTDAQSGMSETSAGVIASLLPNLIAHGIITAEEVDVGTLAVRLRDEAVTLRATSAAAPLVGAWSRKP